MATNLNFKWLSTATPRRLVVYVASLVALANLLIFALLLSSGLLTASWWWLLLVPVFFFVITYFALIFVLKNYIIRKVNLIYKNIHQSKRKGKEGVKDIKMDTDVLGTVQKEVSDWAASQAKEIASLRSMEEYRRNFLGNISHELKTPIFNMQGYLLTLAEGGLYDSNINKEYLNRALVNVERLQTVVDDLEIISRLESGKIMLEIADFDIQELIRECLEDHKMMAKTRNINLSLKDGNRPGYKVSGDRENIRQVLNNLLVNSIKYGKDNGRTQVGCYDMGSYILVEVEDNGIGIGKKDIKHVFDRFYRADKSRSRDMGGSGLGLSIVKHIIEAHKQTINVSSRKGEGATFGFTLQKA